MLMLLDLLKDSLKLVPATTDMLDQSLTTMEHLQWVVFVPQDGLQELDLIVLMFVVLLMLLLLQLLILVNVMSMPVLLIIKLWPLDHHLLVFQLVLLILKIYKESALVWEDIKEEFSEESWLVFVIIMFISLIDLNNTMDYHTVVLLELQLLVKLVDVKVMGQLKCI